MSISIALQALETLSSSPSTSSSGPLNVLLENHFATARSRLEAGDEPQAVISDLQKQVARAKKDVEKGLKTWYGALGNVGKAVDKVSVPNSERLLMSSLSRQTYLPSVRHTMIHHCSLRVMHQRRWIGPSWTLWAEEDCGMQSRLWKR